MMTTTEAGADDVAGAFTHGLRTLLAGLGVDPMGEDVAGTPDRVMRMLAEFTTGYAEDPGKYLARQFAVDRADEMIVVAGIPFVSLCAHHLLPFNGTGAIGYIPAEGARVVGLSKLPRVLHVYARRLQSQEQITVQVTRALEEHLDVRGAACVLRATHGCMAHRGVKAAGAEMVTSSLTGLFRDDPRARAEFLALATR